MPQIRAGPLPVLFFVFFLIWLFSPGEEFPAHSLLLSDIAAQRVQGYRHALDVLDGSSWGDFAPDKEQDAAGLDLAEGYLNLTGFRGERDGFVWEDLEQFRSRGLELSRHAQPPIGEESFWDQARGDPLWTNVSGLVHGDWIRKPGSVTRTFDSYNLTKVVPGLEWTGDKADWARNITGKSGTILLSLEGNKTIERYEQASTGSKPQGGGLIRNMKGTATIEDTTGSGHTWELRLWGLHWPRLGVILLTTTSEKFEGIFGLPHLTPSDDLFSSSQKLLNSTLGAVIARKQDNILVDQNMPWNSDLDNPLYSTFPSPHCELIIYAQVHPPLPRGAGPGSAQNSENAIHAIESELEHPLGAPIERVPRLQMSTVIYSPDCGFFLESKGPPDFPPGEAQHLVGLKTEVHTHHIKSWLLLYALAVQGQVFLLQDQMKETFTPSTMGRVSFWTATIMVLVDGMTFTAAATWVSSAGATFLPTLALMFAAFLSMTIGGSFLGKIFEVQLPESRRRRAGEAASTTGSGDTTNTTASSSTSLTPNPTGPILPGPVTAPRAPVPAPAQSLPIIVSSDGDTLIGDNGASALPTANQPQQRDEAAQTPRQAFQDIIVRMVFVGLCLSALAISSSTWYPSPRNAFLNSCAFCYTSLWLPQIYRNTMRNCRRALRWRFVVGQSVLRLFPVAYFWAYEGNFLFAATDRRAFAVFCGWLWLQIFVLAAQDVVGPRFGVPARWTPEAWDYHPLLREDGLEGGGLPIGLVADDNPGLDKTRDGDDDENKRRSTVRVIDCAICRELLEVPVICADDEASSVASAFARRMYMVTPCRHIFHSACLEGWMKFRLQCPICREELPPL